MRALSICALITPIAASLSASALAGDGGTSKLASNALASLITVALNDRAASLPLNSSTVSFNELISKETSI